MTIQQEAMQMIESMPDESVHFIVALIKKMAPEFRGIETKGRTQDVSKRIGMGKGLINDPEVLLLDEPMGALDNFTRADLQDKILEIRKENRV